MKNNLLATLSVFLLLFLTIHVKANKQGFDEIAGSIRAGNSSALAAHFEGNVEITIKNASNSYSKSQGELVLKDFFTKHTPKTFAIAHQGTSPEGAKYFIGNLITNAGTFRTYVLAKTINNSLVITQVRFEDQ